MAIRMLDSCATLRRAALLVGLVSVAVLGTACPSDDAPPEPTEDVGVDVDPVDAGDGAVTPDGDTPDDGGPDTDPDVPATPTGVVVNEVVLSHGGAGQGWVELFNVSAEPVDLMGWELVVEGGGNEDTFDLSPIGILAAGDYTVLDGGTLGAVAIPVSSGSLQLFAGDDVIDSTAWTAAQAPPTTSWGRIPNGTGDFQTLFTPTQGEENVANPTGECGDGVCDPTSEDCQLCPEDCPVCLPGPNELVITELMKNPVSVDDATGEWFEVLNVSDGPRELAGLGLTDLDADAPELHVVAPEGGSLVVEAGAYALFARSADLGMPGGGVTADYVYGGVSLGNGDDVLAIVDGTAIVDQLAYTDADFPDAAGASMALEPTVQSAQANDDASSWCAGYLPYGDGTNLGTPGEANPECGAAPVLVDVALNEIVPNAAAAAGTGDWVELYNYGSEAVALGGWTVSNAAGDSVTVPAGTTLAAGAFLLWTEADLGFALADDGEVTLADLDGFAQDSVDWAAGAAPEGTSWGRLPDGTGGWDTLEVLTPGAPNVKELADCGDALCGGGETCATCPGDCGECSPLCGTHLFFSQYVEGSSSNKAFELYNGTGVPVDLGSYQIWRISNGGTWDALTDAGVQTLSGTLAPAETYVICDEDSDPVILDVCDMVLGSGVVFFNGDDALGLAYAGVLVDSIGEQGDDPGDGWTVAGVGDATQNHTLVRAADVLTGTTDWAAAATTQWIVLPQDDFSGMGEHTTTSFCGVDLPQATVAINEVAVDDGAGGSFLELVNLNAEFAADLGGFSINGESGGAYTLPAGTIVGPGAFAVWTDADLGFGFAADGSVTLLDAEGLPHDVTDWFDGDAPSGRPWGRFPDGTGSYATLGYPTPGAPNVLDVPECGDGTCEGLEGCTSCEADCGVCPVCGNGTCEPGETPETCDADCQPVVCGDGVCAPGEDCLSCQADCGECVACGDGACTSGEDCLSCEGDCGVCSGEPCAATLFFSEYVEGSSNNKAVEIVNLTGVAVDLADYAVWRISNGGEWADFEYPLEGTLEPGDVYVICHSSFDASALGPCDLVESGPVNFNGDDAVGLAYLGELVDQIGDVGPDVGTGWQVGTTPEATANHTLRRKATITSGSIDWVGAAASEWIVLPENTFDGLGAHDAAFECSFGPSAGVVVNELVAAAVDAGDDWVELYNLDDTPFDLSGWSLADAGGASYAFPAGTVVDASGYLLVTQTDLGFDLEAADALTLADAAGEMVDMAAWQDGDAPEAASWGRFPNGLGPFQTLLTVTPAEANSDAIPPLCGDGECNGDEGCASCEADCGACPFCGDGACGGDENCETCVDDCGACPECGDGVCADNEDCAICEADCGACPVCGDGECNGDETCETCEADCGACPLCGDGACNGDEDCTTCADDCGACPFCGDGVCGDGESCLSCPGDCGACGTGCAPALLFSEYVEGSSNNKALELYNNTGKALNLAAYALWRISNGGDWVEGEGNAYQLSGVIGAGETFVVCNSSIDEAVLPQCDLTVGGTPIGFNGDDAMGLAVGGELVDAIGEEGEDPGDGFAIGELEAQTANHTLRRLEGVTFGHPDWATGAETWEVLPSDTFDGLGAHTIATDCVEETVDGVVVLNEVVTAPLGGGPDWVELHNPSADVTVDLSGWLLSDGGGDTVALPEGTVLAPGAYLLVDGDTYDFGLAAGDSLVLSDGAGVVFDTTSWSDLDAPEGTSWGRFPNGTGPFQTLNVPTPGGVNTDALAPACGDGYCNGDETCETCEADCGACPDPCGDGVCDGEGGEDCATCAADCGACPECGDAVCSGDETCATCPGDCGACPECGDGACNGDETCETCEADCGACPVTCGDGSCVEADGEDCASCPVDCGACPECGDGTCNGDETCESCEGDCGVCPEGCAEELFFSEYVEGSSFNKAVEVANFTGSDVDLAGYEIWKISNGGDWAEGQGNGIALSGVLADGDVIVLCDDGFGTPELCDVLSGGQALNFNGDDAVGLAKGGVLIDTIGEEGPDVGDGWEVAGVAEATKDHTLRRKPAVLGGSLDWATAQATGWDVLDNNTFDGLGSHTVLGECGGGGDPVAFCGDGSCDPDEDCTSCELDCGPCEVDPCGDGVCDAGGGEDCATCAPDCGACPEPKGDCCLPPGNGTPGCDDAACEATVCASDALCCDTAWDEFCATIAGLVCTELCADTPIGPFCGDDSCDTGAGENCGTCESDCGGCLVVGCAPTLIISEYVEGSSSNKALELFNGTGGTVDLSEYALWKIANGGDWATEGAGNEFALSGTLADGETWVICDDSSDFGILDVCDQQVASNPMNYNGDDAVALVWNGVIVDHVGDEGDDPGDGWDVAGVADATANHTLRRDPQVVVGSTDWATASLSEWTVFEQDTFSGLGTHVVSAVCGDPTDCCEAKSITEPGCSDTACAAEICEFDAFCCTVHWDSSCATSAQLSCTICNPVCGDGECTAGAEDCASCADDCGACPGGESTCCTESFGLGCDDPTCEAAVCAEDEFCCSFGWDGFCVAISAVACPELCPAELP